MLSGLLLAALLLRAWIPVGFMPASGSPFLLQLCPAVGEMPRSMAMAAAGGAHAHHHHAPGPDHGADPGADPGAGHGAGHSHFENCPYGSAPAAGPLSQLLAFEPPPQVATAVAASPVRVTLRTPPRRAHQPRGPPTALA